MLIFADQISQELRDTLGGFLRYPFSKQSCQLVEARVPQLAGVYRRLAADHAARASQGLPWLADNVESVFSALPTHPSGPEVADTLLTAQVILLDEYVRDAHEGLRSKKQIAASGKMSMQDAVMTLRAASFHEALFLKLAGAFELRVDGSSYRFDLTALGRECVRNRTTTVTMQHQTEAALLGEMTAVASTLRQLPSKQVASVARKISLDQLDLLAGRLLDCFFSLSTPMQRDPAVRPIIARAFQFCRWIALLQLVRSAEESELWPHAELVEDLALDRALLDEVIVSQATRLASDQGIYHSPSGAITLGKTSLAHAINCCKRVVLDENQSRQLGEPFELHVRNFIKDNISPDDYIVGGRVQKGPNGPGINYDCDLTLYEPRRKKIFFIQAKWKRDGRTASLEDELRAWRAKNVPMDHGVGQLEGLRKRLSEHPVCDKVRSALPGIRLTDKEIQDNAHFIIIHTLPYFSAYSNRGVVIYEWNLFRNLLRRGMINHTAAPQGDWNRATSHTSTSAGILPLEDPEQVIAHYFRATGFDQVDTTRAMDRRLNAQYFFDLEFAGKRFWQRATRYYITRPCT